MLTPSQLSISQAAKEVGIARSTMYTKYIKSGAISVSVNSHKEKYISQAELSRVFDLAPPTEEIAPVSDAEKDKTILELEATNKQLKFSIMVAETTVKRAEENEKFLKQTVVALTNRLTHQDSTVDTVKTADKTGNTPTKQARTGLISRLIKWLV